MTTTPYKRLGEAVRRLRKQAGLSQIALALEANINHSNISRLETGKSRPEEKAMRGIAQSLGVTLSQLYAMAEGGRPNVEEGPDIRGLFPLISWVRAGNWCEVHDEFSLGDAEAWYPCPVTCGNNTFVLRVRGVSMEPEYHDGDLIFVDPDHAPVNGSDVVVRVEDSETVTFKQLVVEGDSLYLRPRNKDWPEKIIPLADSSVICGVVRFSGRIR